ncbi:hypothetical protein [Mucilaginibacter agri]|uniref:Outer membrane protein beta-barrel domain-containing protein n=1 Tax=Mucilaginibacter agri TaxID=2695265 RepID=A0A965ZEP7_9SPHI|nr:hypothetical protein [Mucilaginibacter agri]NCD68386.1 hypothetical protein [Mucilaginibacter agri]
MKKSFFLITIVALSIFTSKVKAQHYNNTYREDSWHVTIGPDFLAIVNPTSQAIDPPSAGSTTKVVNYSRLGIGGSIHAEYYPSPFVGLTIGTGGEFIPAASNNRSDVKDLFLVPVKIGAKAFFSQSWYLGAEAGIAYASVAYKDSHRPLLVSPQLGYNDNDTGWDINLRYEVMHGKNQYMSMFGLHVAYSFDLSKGY